MSDDEDEYMYDSDEDDSAEYLDEEGFDAPPVEAHEQVFSVLDGATCLECAQTEVRDTSDLLCVPAATAEVLLRAFRWDREKLTEGAPHPHQTLTQAPPAHHS